MKLNLQVKRGATRWVLLLGNYAFKFPRIHLKRDHRSLMWKLFLQGLLGNMQENVFGRSNLLYLCPVVFRIPGGFLTVMPRVTPLTDEQWEAFNINDLENNHYSLSLIENKQDSFGYLNGHIVVVDYGS